MSSPDSTLHTPLEPWLEGLDTETLREMVRRAAHQVPEFGAWLARQQAGEPTDADDTADLLSFVDAVLTPDRPFYIYREADDYAMAAADVVDVLVERAAAATPELLPVIERAITLVTRAILRSDDSSGLQGQLVHELLDAHAEAARTAQPSLGQQEQTRLVTWLLEYRYGGEQDFFDPDIVAYAPALSAESLAQYRASISSLDLGSYGRYPLARLAVLDGDRDAIIAAAGGEPWNVLVAARLVRDLEEAGLHDDAVEYARRGLRVDDRGWDPELVTFLVDDALARGDHVQAVDERRDWFVRFPHAFSFNLLRETAQQVDVWEQERHSAEERLAEHAPTAFTRHLTEEGRDEEAWRFASERLDPADHVDVWQQLCERRAHTRPADTLPIYRELITAVLTVTDKRNYRAAAQTLQIMRTAADDAGPRARAEFDVFMAETAERNRRRPKCLEAFTRAGLIPRR